MQVLPLQLNLYNMKKLLLILLLTPFFANSQVVNTILRKNTATKVISSYSSGSAGSDTLANVYKLETFTEGQVPAWDATNKRFIASTAALSGINTFVFSRDASDISGYKQAVSLNSYVEGAKDTATITATTGGVLMQEFATNVGFPGITVIQPGEFRVYYESKKSSGGQNYWTYAVVLKRNLAGTETVIDTTELSTVTSENTLQNVSVGFLVTENISLLSSDRLVVKIYAQMQSSTSDVDLYYDDATYARLTLPSASVDATNFVPYVGATKDLDMGFFDVTADSLRAGVAILEKNIDAANTGLIVSNPNTGLNSEVLMSLNSDVASLDFRILGNNWDGGLNGNQTSILASHKLSLGSADIMSISGSNGIVLTSPSVKLTDLPAATPGTDSLVVHDNTTNTLSRLDPKYYVRTNGTDTIIGRKTFNDLIISRDPTAFFLGSYGATTGGSGIEIANTGGQMRLGTEGSSGGVFFTGSSAYASVIGAANNTSMEFFTNNVKRMTIANSGEVTVTGALSGTSATFSSSVTATAAGGGGHVVTYGKASPALDATATLASGVSYAIVAIYETTNTGNGCVLLMAAGVLTIISNPSGLFTTTVDTASKWNVTVSSGVISIQNKRASGDAFSATINRLN